MNTATTICLIILALNIHLSESSYRLPTSVKPTFYSLTILTDLDRGSFSGFVRIYVRVQYCNIHTIKLHSSNLTVTELYLDEQAASYRLEPEFEILEIFYNDRSRIAPGFHRIEIKYTGSLLNKTAGYFKTQYTNENGTILSHLAATDFESTYARTAFPCFDEPGLKAKFKITLVIPAGAGTSNYTALSNMKEICRFTNSKGTFYKFQTTCLMSPYLLAFAIAPYSYVEQNVKINNRKIPIRIYSYNVTEESSEHILGYASRSLQFYEDYLGFHYPLPKIDLIEYDREASSATENWGLITVRKNLLQQTSEFDTTQIFGVITHEIAHFWFGNLVTNDWWDDLWLQEAFAEYMAIKAGKIILNMTDDSSTEDLYIYDQQNETSPIVTKRETPSEIQDHFNDIVYFKGSAVLGMLEFVVGEDIFQKILREYIQTFKFCTATTNDFLEIVEKYGDKTDLREFLESYLYQNRYPVITAEEAEEGNVYVLKQRSCTNEDTSNNNSYSYKWTIPITYITSLEQEKYTLLWFDKDMDNLTIPRGNESWIKFNYQHIGFYRMNYSESLWSKLYEHAKEIVYQERYHVLTEAVHLFDSDFISCEVPLKYLVKIVGDLEHIPWTVITTFNYYLENGGFKNDNEATDLFENFLNLLQDQQARSRKTRNQRSESSSNPISDKVKICAKWIKENLNNNVI